MNEILSKIEQCLIPKLSKSVDKSEHHEEFETHKKRLQEHFDSVLHALGDIESEKDIVAKVLAAVLIFYKELLTEGPWHTKDLVEYANKLNVRCALLFEVSLEDLLKKEHKLDKQRIFDECLQYLHGKLTTKDFKKFPSLIEVYCSIIADIQDHSNITLTVKILPVSLHLIDDYIVENKKKGLKCCKNILKHLNPDDFAGGNYYEVIYASLKKVITEREIELTSLVIECLLQLLRLAPTDNKFKIQASEEVYSVVLDQIQSESNLYRKALLFHFTRNLIAILSVNCIGKKMFLTAIYNNLEICCNDGVEDILLSSVLECFEEWLKHCWCLWRLRTGQTIISALLKLLYTCNNNHNLDKIVKIIATLISLCNETEKAHLLEKLKTCEINNEQYQNRLSLVNKTIFM